MPFGVANEFRVCVDTRVSVLFPMILSLLQLKGTSSAMPVLLPLLTAHA